MIEDIKKNRPLLDKPAAALASGFKERALDHIISKGLLPVVHIGRRVYIKQSELDKLMENGTPPKGKRTHFVDKETQK